MALILAPRHLSARAVPAASDTRTTASAARRTCVVMCSSLRYAHIPIWYLHCQEGYHIVPPVPDGRQARGSSPFGLRHRTAREAVMASQRGRVLEAMVKAVAEKGYAATTIADVVARAGVSRRTFYEQFRDKEACFLAAFDTGVAFVRTRIEEEFA